MSGWTSKDSPTNGYDEDECTELSNSTWECEHHEDDDHGDHDVHHGLAVVYPDNTSVMFDVDHDERSVWLDFP